MLPMIINKTNSMSDKYSKIPFMLSTHFYKKVKGADIDHPLFNFRYD